MTGSGARNQRTVVNAFRFDDAYHVKHYFEGEAVFARLRRYYEPSQYRFSVPTREFDGVQRFLADHGYRLEPVADLDPYTVAVEKYTAHPENIFKESVHQWSHSGFTCFLLKDHDAVGRAVADGATRLRELDLTLERGGQQRLPAT